MSHRILIAGVGNSRLGDDGFGGAVIRHLLLADLAPSVVAHDFGVGELHLAMELLEPNDLVIVADTLPRGGSPGTLYLIEPEIDDEPHGALGTGPTMNLSNVLGHARAMGADLPNVLVLGCEPGQLSEGTGLSAHVELAVPTAAGLVHVIVDRVLEGHHPDARA